MPPRTKPVSHTRPTKNKLTVPSGTVSRTRKGERRITEIMTAARDLFVNKGYIEMTMRQVAEKTGMSLSNLQHYFPSREELLRAVLWDVATSYDDKYGSLDLEKKTPIQRFTAVMSFLLADIRQPETEKLFVEIWSLASRDPIAREVLDQMYTYHRKNVERLIADVNPELPAQKISLRACLIAMQIEGLILILSDTKPKHRELKGIEQECLKSMLLIVQAH